MGGFPNKSDLSGAERARLMRGGGALHDRGPRVVAEVLIEIAERYGEPARLLDIVATYTRLPPDLYAAVGADRLPRTALAEVRR